MQFFSRGWNFLTQSWKMAATDRDLLKPSIYAILVGFVVSLVGAIPIILSIMLFGMDGLLGRIVAGFFGILLIFAQYSITYIFSAMTVKLIYDYLTSGDGEMDKAWEMVKRDWLDILTLAAASTLVNMIKNMVRGSGKNRNFIRESIANLIDTLWTEATYLVLPIMVLEDINLKDGLKRATYIVKNNLIPVAISTIGVRWVTGLIGFFFAVIGLGIGFGIAFPLISIAGSSTVMMVIAIVLAVLVASVFFMAGNVINSYTSTAYHTCLYLWAHNTEQAGQGETAAIPAPLAAVLGN